MSIAEINVIFVGKLSLPRSEMQEEARQFGLTVKSALSKRVDYLVTSPQIVDSVHVQKAREVGITVITEKEYRQFLPQIVDGIRLLNMLFSQKLSDVQQGLILLKTKQAQVPKNEIPIRIQHFSSIRWSLYSNIRHLKLVGDPKEQKLKFSELLLEAEIEEEDYSNWRNDEVDNRTHQNISASNFSNLRTLIIQDDPIAGQINISSPKIEKIVLKNLPSLTNLTISTACKKLWIQDCPNLVHMNINTEKLSHYRLQPALKNGISDVVNLNSPEQIAAHLTKQKEDLVEIIDDSVYGYTFTGKHAHITHHETWVERYHYEGSFSFLIDFLKFAFDPVNEKDAYKHPLRSNSRVKIYSEEFGFDFDCTTNCGYDLDYYEIADWKNRALSVDPEFNYSGKSYDHDTDSKDYQLLIQPISKALGIYPPSFAELILSYFSPELVKELAQVHRDFHPES